MTELVTWRNSTVAKVGEQEYDISELIVDGVTFETSVLAVRPSRIERFSLQKSRAMVERYLRLVQELPARRIVELGVFRGGSTAFFALLPETEVIVAVEIDDLDGSALQQFIETRGLQQSVHLADKTDQTDRVAIERTLREAQLSEIDLVIDDASHRYAETVASFELLFPRLRPGGIYLIEDWRWAHERSIGLGPEFTARAQTPLTQLAFELVMGCGTDDGVVRHIEVDKDMLIIERGDTPLDHQRFQITDLYDDISADLLGDWSDA